MIAAQNEQSARAERRAEIAQARERALRQQAVMGATVARMSAKSEHRSGFVVLLVRCAPSPPTAGIVMHVFVAVLTATTSDCM